jgi:penicillin-binding protein 1C
MPAFWKPNILLLLRHLFSGYAAKRRWWLLSVVPLSVVFWFILPQPLFKVGYSSLLQSREGVLLGARIAADQQWRFPMSSVVPPKFQQCLINYEDKRFFSHPGIDPLALARAISLNLQQGSVVSGGSTLTMQVLRLARGNPARTYAEKLTEMILALRLELSAGKEEILALYAAHAPFGGNVVGLEAAAWRYFGRAPAQLSWAESCMLAVLPNNPALIHPGRNRQQLQVKRDTLLQRLHETGDLSALELELARHEPLAPRPAAMPQRAPHLLDTLVSRYGNGRRFVSTLDAGLQGRVAAMVQQHGKRLHEQRIDNVAALVIDNRRFEVLAYVGNANSSPSGESGYAIDLIQRPRSSGSILKPFLFATMLDAGEITPTMLVPDLPTQYGGYIPENYDKTYRGAVPAREALSRSLNVPAVRMLRRHGVPRFYDFLQQLGVTTLFRPPDEYGLSLILGGAETTLWEMGSAYANLAALTRVEGDSYRQPRWLLEQGEETSASPSGISPGAAWLTQQALQEVNRPGSEGFWKKFSSAKRIAWKTGTSYGLRDAWAIGSNDGYTVAVWAGNASGEGVPELTGTAAAAPLLFEIFGALGGNWFEPPRWRMKEVETCKDDGYLAVNDCESERQWLPDKSHFEQVSPHHLWVHLDPSGAWRVDSGCEPVATMRHRSWFVLPPGQAHYYQKRFAHYQPLPPFRADCREQRAEVSVPIELLYPTGNTRLYVPVDLDGKPSRVVFEAVHRDGDALLFWHLDDEYLGTTRTFHQQALLPGRGMHTLTLVDEQGNRLRRRFEVLGRGGAE